MIKDNSVFVLNGKEIEKNNIKSFVHSNKPKQLYKCKYLQKDMEKWYSNKTRVKDIIHEKFEKYLFENQNNKLNIEIIPIDKKKVIFKQSFNKLTKNNSELLVKEVYTQIRKEYFKIMIELSNTINETKYSKCFVTFFIHLRNKLLNETSKASFGKEMTSYLLKIVKEKFENPPKEIPKKEGESIEDEQKRKEQIEIEEFEYNGTARFISELFNQSVVVADLVLLCLDTLSKIRNKSTTKAFTTLLSNTYKNLLKVNVSKDKLFDLISIILTPEKRGFEKLSFMEKVWIENVKVLKNLMKK